MNTPFKFGLTIILLVIALSIIEPIEPGDLIGLLIQITLTSTGILSMIAGSFMKGDSK
jgi:hypothetical protein